MMIGFTRHKVHHVRFLTANTFVVRFERKNLSFTPGQYIVVGIEGDFNTREYSIYSALHDNYLEILVREIKDGYLSPRLKALKMGDHLIVYGPFGEFTVKQNELKNKEFVMIASGTGISPLHSIVKSYSDIDYQLIHGVRYMSEAYDKEAYTENRYQLCLSKDQNGPFFGRVTAFLASFIPNQNQIFYISGNNMMITDVIEMLKNKGVKVEQYNLEIYF